MKKTMCKTLVFWMLRKWSLSIKFPDMKKKGLIFKSWWFWVVIVVIIGLIIFFFPKSCGVNPGIGSSVASIDCSCIGLMRGGAMPSCYGICVKSSCKTTVTNSTNPPVENNTITPPVSDTNISLINSLKLSIKAPNPQYKEGQNITIQYTLENTKNETLIIPGNVANGIEIKNSGGKILDYTGSGLGIKIFQDSISLSPLQKTTGSFVIGANDYDLLTNGSPSDGYYNTITAHIGDVNSNRLILRIILK